MNIVECLLKRSFKIAGLLAILLGLAISSQAFGQYPEKVAIGMLANKPLMFPRVMPSFADDESLFVVIENKPSWLHLSFDFYQNRINHSHYYDDWQTNVGLDNIDVGGNWYAYFFVNNYGTRYLYYQDGHMMKFWRKGYLQPEDFTFYPDGYELQNVIIDDEGGIHYACSNIYGFGIDTTHVTTVADTLPAGLSIFAFVANPDNSIVAALVNQGGIYGKCFGMAGQPIDFSVIVPIIGTSHANYDLTLDYQGRLHSVYHTGGADWGYHDAWVEGLGTCFIDSSYDDVEEGPQFQFIFREDSSESILFVANESGSYHKFFVQTAPDLLYRRSTYSLNVTMTIRLSAIRTYQDTINFFYNNFDTVYHIAVPREEIVDNVVGIDQSPILPEEIGLKIKPNPFNVRASIEFSLKSRGEVAIRAFDINGRLAATLYHGELSSGKHTITWNADNFPSGIYFFRLEGDTQTSIAKCLLLK